MFTGIIKAVGKVEKLAGGKLTLLAEEIARGLKPGDSLAVSGVCLTLVRAEGPRLAMDVLEETLRVTNLGGLKPGDPVNLEPALRAGEEMGGHFVTGHVDGVGRLAARTAAGRDWVLTIALPPALLAGVVGRGSIAVEGVSLTVADLTTEGVAVHLVPYTFRNTTLGTKPTGALLNIETDLLGKYVSNFLSSAVPAGNKKLDEDYLRERGFL